MQAVYLLSAVAVLPLAHGLAWGGPAPTPASAHRELNGWTPKPTNGPSIEELRRRQTNYEPATCGWIDQDFASPISCKSGRTCMLYTTASGGTTGGMAGCCTAGDTQNCGWSYDCVDYDNYVKGNCDSSCDADTFVLKCTATDMPYCTTWMYGAESVVDYGCGSGSLDTLQTIWQEATDSVGDTTSMSLPTISNNAVSFADVSSELTDTETATDSITDTATTETTEPPASPTDPAPSNGKPKTTKKKKSNTGLIGGVVGGVVGVLALIGGALLVFCLKKRKDKQQQQPPPQHPSAMQHSTPNPPPVTAAAQQFPPMQQTQQVPPPQTPGPDYGYFNQDQKIHPQTQVHEYGAQTPISNPASPAPPYNYVQPYYANSPVVPPVPTQSPQPYQTPPPANGAVQLDAISVVPAVPAAQAQPGQAQAVVHEIGGPGK